MYETLIAGAEMESKTRKEKFQRVQQEYDELEKKSNVFRNMVEEHGKYIRRCVDVINEQCTDEKYESSNGNAVVNANMR